MARPLPTQQFTYLHYRLYRPVAALCPWVQCYWSIGGQAEIGKRTVFEETLYPDAGASLMIVFGRNKVSTCLHFANQTQRQSFDSHVEILSVRFWPGGVYQFFGMAPIPGKQILNDGITEFDCRFLQAQMAQCGSLSVEQRINLLEQWLLQRARERQPVIGRVQKVWQNLAYPDGTGDIDWSRFGLTRRTLERDFRREVGCSPSQLKQCWRMKQARRLLAESPMAVADIGLACGYYDQAHFTHVFKGFVGETPGTYRLRKMS